MWRERVRGMEGKEQDQDSHLAPGWKCCLKKVGTLGEPVTVVWGGVNQTGEGGGEGGGWRG